MRRILVLGTNNKHKVEEIKPHFTGMKVELRLAGSYGNFDPVEDGGTLEENAIVKARAALALSGEWSMADDTGLEVDALEGRPGIHAARYAGPQCSFEDNITKLLGELEGVPEEKRTARFVCVIALCCPDRHPMIVKGTCAGRILKARKGDRGFGYDPVFGIDELGKSFAELTLDEKNRISHRGRAVKLFRREILDLLAQEEFKRNESEDGREPT